MKPDVSNRLVQMLLLTMLATSGCAPDEPPQRPNVVVILLDTLRPDYLGFYGYEKEMAPFLARLASESVVFERAFSTSSWTALSTSSLFTSLYPPQHAGALRSSGRSEEKRNVYRHYRDVPGVRLVAMLEEFKDREVRESPEAVQVELDDELKETLKSLGYVNQ